MTKGRPKVELVYFTECPHIELARTSLEAALVEVGLTGRWQEWNQDDPAAPERIRGFGSPTILVDGQDVSGVGPRSHGHSCRADGVPKSARIAAALRGHAEGNRGG
jgi:mercuric ion transport protein